MSHPVEKDVANPLKIRMDDEVQKVFLLQVLYSIILQSSLWPCGLLRLRSSWWQACFLSNWSWHGIQLLAVNDHFTSSQYCYVHRYPIVDKSCKQCHFCNYVHCLSSCAPVTLSPKICSLVDYISSGILVLKSIPGVTGSGSSYPSPGSGRSHPFPRRRR